MLGTLDDGERRHLLTEFDGAVLAYAPKWNDLVLMIERSNARNTFLMFFFRTSWSASPSWAPFC